MSHIFNIKNSVYDRLKAEKELLGLSFSEMIEEYFKKVDSMKEAKKE